VRSKPGQLLHRIAADHQVQGPAQQILPQAGGDARPDPHLSGVVAQVAHQFGTGGGGKGIHQPGPDDGNGAARGMADQGDGPFRLDQQATRPLLQRFPRQGQAHRPGLPVEQRGAHQGLQPGDGLGGGGLGDFVQPGRRTDRSRIQDRQEDFKAAQVQRLPPASVLVHGVFVLPGPPRLVASRPTYECLRHCALN
jgi:hypothetical protein